MDLWQTRQISWEYLNTWHSSRVSVILRTFELIDSCVDEYESRADSDTYARISGLTLLKAKNLAIASLSLILDGLGQESGALLRPMVEYVELLTYLRQFPNEAERAAQNDLPKAGQRAKAISGVYQGLRDYLNEHASHSSYSNYSLSHLLTRELKFRKLQEFVPHVLEKNLRDFTVHLQLMLQEAVLALQPLNSSRLVDLALAADRLKLRMLDVFSLANS
jgi:hypothetical protein